MFRKKKLATTRYWINRNVNERVMRIENSAFSTIMMNKAII